MQSKYHHCVCTHLGHRLPHGLPRRLGSHTLRHYVSFFLFYARITPPKKHFILVNFIFKLFSNRFVVTCTSLQTNHFGISNLPNFEPTEQFICHFGTQQLNLIKRSTNFHKAIAERSKFKLLINLIYILAKILIKRSTGN